MHILRTIGIKTYRRYQLKRCWQTLTKRTHTIQQPTMMLRYTIQAWEIDLAVEKCHRHFLPLKFTCTHIHSSSLPFANCTRVHNVYNTDSIAFAHAQNTHTENTAKLLLVCLFVCMETERAALFTTEAACIAYTWIASKQMEWNGRTNSIKPLNIREKSGFFFLEPR